MNFLERWKLRRAVTEDWEAKGSPENRALKGLVTHSGWKEFREMIKRERELRMDAEWLPDARVFKKYPGLQQSLDPFIQIPMTWENTKIIWPLKVYCKSRTRGWPPHEEAWTAVVYQQSDTGSLVCTIMEPLGTERGWLTFALKSPDEFQEMLDDGRLLALLKDHEDHVLKVSGV